jgi:hypothetical protein
VTATFHRITVRVRRDGVDVRARRGFWAFDRAQAARVATHAPAVPTPVQEALGSIAGRGRADRYVETWVGMQRGDDGRTRLRLVWEPVRAVPADRRAGAERVLLVATTADGGEVFRGHVPESDDGPAGPQQAIFDAAPGSLVLRLVVQDATGGTLDQETLRVDAPDLTGPAPQLSTPRVHRARTARDVRIIAGEADTVPVAAREFSRSERLLIRFDVHAPGSERPQPAAALLNRTGQTVVDLPVSPATAGGTHQIDLGLSSVPPGDYLIEISVTSELGTARELVAFRIGA